MVEYLHDAIRATAGDSINIVAKVTDERGIYQNQCYLELSDEEKVIMTIKGVFNGTVWFFTIPEDTTVSLKGRYWYSVLGTETILSFKQPIYFV